MTEATSTPTSWAASGLIFENCSCQAVCPGHIHFDQMCYGDRCIGYWAIRFDAGNFDGVDLAGVKTVIAYDCPPHMIDGNWTQVFLIDDAAGADQQRAVEAILGGTAGGPWAILARFVGRQLPTQRVPIAIAENERSKSVSVPDILSSTITELKGRDRAKPVTFNNMYNQIHPPEQALATGSSTYNDGDIRFATENTHGLYSHFHWQVEV